MGTIFLLIIVFLLALALIKLNSPEFKGKSGEKLVAERLDIISGYKHIMNDVIFDDNGQSRQVDHIAITEYGVYVIETKNYTGNIYGKETSNEWKQYINKQCFKFKNPIHQNYGHLQIVKQHIEQITKEIYPIVTFIRRCNLKVDTSSPVVYEDQLSTYIMGRSKVLNIEQIDNIYEILSKWRKSCIASRN